MVTTSFERALADPTSPNSGVDGDDGALFAVLDVETTGLSPMTGDRIVEIAILRVRPDGSSADEYTTLVNPLRDVGEPSYHGIVNEDVEAAPTFHEIVGDVMARLRGVILVGHNVKFDRDFLAAELARECVFLPGIPSICTLQVSYRLYPRLANHKLSTCCQGAGVDEATFHSALEDARVTARLLMTYVREAGNDGMTMQDLLEGGTLVFPPAWPDLPMTGRVQVRLARSTARLDPPYLARLVASLAAVTSNEVLAPYHDLLDRALLDRRVTSEEAKALEATAAAWGLSREQVIIAHDEYLEALVSAALADGVITSSERRDLNDVTRLLGIPVGTLDAIIAIKTPAAV